MALNTWWDGDATQRYWMEVATTGHMGELIIAPKFPGASWSYELVSQVRPGDRVLHWQAEGPHGRGLVGWSVAKAAPEVSAGYRWKPRGMSGRRKNTDRVTDAWMVELGGFNRFSHPLTSELLQVKRDAVMDAYDELEAKHGKPVYYPFYVYGRTQLRAQQGYLMKFPVELFDVLPQIAEARRTAVPGAVAGVSPTPGVPVERRQRRTSVALRPVEPDDLPDEHVDGPRAPRGRTTRAQDPILRSAIENHAVDRAIDHFRALGATDVVKLGKPYDIQLRLDGTERHIEVKGSSVEIDTVELTINEVTHAADHGPTDLVVVDDIDWVRNDDGAVSCVGGRFRIWRDWTPAPADLAPRRFAYSLPPSD